MKIIQIATLIFAVIIGINLSDLDQKISDQQRSLSCVNAAQDWLIMPNLEQAQ